MSSIKTQSGKTAKTQKAHPSIKEEGRQTGKSSPSATEQFAKSLPPSPIALPRILLSYEPHKPMVYYPDKVKIVSLGCTQPVLHPDHPEIFLVQFTMEVRNLIPEELEGIQCRLKVHDSWTIAVAYRNLRGNETIPVSGQFGAISMVGTLSPAV